LKCFQAHVEEMQFVASFFSFSSRFMHNAIINGKEPSSNGRDLLMHNLGELEPLGKDLELGSHSTLQVESVNLLKGCSSPQGKLK
jgi:hypothetical protein